MTGWTLRAATVADLDQLVALEREIFAEEAWSRAMLRDEIQGRHTLYLVAAPEDAPERVLGYAGLRAPRGSGDGDIQNIAVAPASRRLGIARALLAALHDEARRRGARELFLDVRVDNESAQELYRSFGYETIGVRRGYYQPSGTDAYAMRARLGGPRETGSGAAGTSHAESGA